ncbi:MAG TPA: two-component sensor histidine kinase, partial [Trichococcus flocculiformis]|nr:two-component sensor histidine kinase [Trichococcus flocculiformis]
MRRTISWQLIFSFLLFSIVIIGLFGWFSVRLLDSHFSEYVSERRTEEITGFTDEIEAVYAQEGSWDEDAIAVIGRQALQADIILKVYDNQGALIWTPTAMEEQDNRQMMSSHMSQMNEMMGGTESEYTVTTVELSDGTRTIGSLAIGTMGTYFYTEHDVSFMSDIRNNLLIVALLAFALSLFFAVWIARKLSVPVFAVSRFTGEIAKGNYTEPAPKETNIVEIDALIRSVDS